MGLLESTALTNSWRKMDFAITNLVELRQFFISTVRNTRRLKARYKELLPGLRHHALVSWARSMPERTYLQSQSAIRKKQNIYDSKLLNKLTKRRGFGYDKRQTSTAASPDLSFKTARNDAQENLSILSCEAALSDESVLINAAVETQSKRRRLLITKIGKSKAITPRTKKWSCEKWNQLWKSSMQINCRLWTNIS